MTDRAKNSEEIEQDAGARDIAESERGPVKDPDSSAVGASTIDSSAAEAEPTI